MKINFFLINLSLLFTYCLSYLSSKVIALHLGPLGLGSTGSFLSYSTIIATISIGCYPNEIPKELSGSRRGFIQTITDYLLSSIIVLFFLQIIVALVFFIANKSINLDFIFCGFVYAFFSCISLLVGPVFSALGKIEYYSLYSIVSSCFNFISFLFLFQYWEFQLPIVLAVSFAFGSIAGLFALIVFDKSTSTRSGNSSGFGEREKRRVPPPFGQMLFKKSLLFVVSSVLNGSLILISYCLYGGYASGLFKACISIVLLLFSLSSVIHKNILLPSLLSLREKDIIQNNLPKKIFLYKYLPVLCISCASVVFILFPKLCLRFFYNSGFEAASSSLVILIFSVILRSIYYSEYLVLLALKEDLAYTLDLSFSVAMVVSVVLPKVLNSEFLNSASWLLLLSSFVFLASAKLLSIQNLKS